MSGLALTEYDICLSRQEHGDRSAPRACLPGKDGRAPRPGTRQKHRYRQGAPEKIRPVAGIGASRDAFPACAGSRTSRIRTCNGTQRNRKVQRRGSCSRYAWASATESRSSSSPSFILPAGGCSLLHSWNPPEKSSCPLLRHGHVSGQAPATAPAGQDVHQDQHFFATTTCFPCSDPGAPLPAAPDAPATRGNGPARRHSLSCSPDRAPI